MLELEDLLRTHPLIEDCRVVGVPDSRTGELPKALVIRRNKTLAEQDVKDFVKGMTGKRSQQTFKKPHLSGPVSSCSSAGIPGRQSLHWVHSKMPYCLISYHFLSNANFQ